jgi:uncharacterized protein with NRDE domain
MCLLAFALDCHPRYSLVLAANRDENFIRPTAPARYWDDAPQILAGRDQEAGGTWLGLSRNGRLAALTNYYAPDEYQQDKLSRGLLITDFLTGELSPREYLERLRKTGVNYNGFGLVFGDTTGLNYATNRGPSISGISAGVHGLSNHLLDTHWPKVTAVKARLQRIVGNSDIIDPETLFALLADRTRYPDLLLPDTGVGIQRERSLSSIFVSREEFGTRCSTVILIGRDNRMSFLERSFDALQNTTGTVEFHVDLNSMGQNTTKGVPI